MSSQRISSNSYKDFMNEENVKLDKIFFLLDISILFKA